MIIPKLKFSLYGLIIVLSIFIGLFYIFRNLKKSGYYNKKIILFILLFIPCAFVFGKIYTLITDPEQKSIITVGLSAYGGLIGVIIASIIFEYIVPTNKMIIKYSVLSLPLIYGLTKIACFISGCCYGIPYNGPLYVIYPDGLNIPQFPVQITETIASLIVFVICNKLKNNKYIIYITLLLTSFVKFSLDFLRYDHIKKIITPNQIFSIILVIITIIIFVYQKRRKYGK